MELLRPSPPPLPSTAPSLAALRQFLASPPAAPPAGKVHVAVGRSASKTLALLQWTFRHFGCTELTLVHVHQPSSMIPTALGKLPASRANEISLSAHRRKERDETNKILLSYLSTCYRAQVQANIIMTESENIHKGIINMVANHGIQKLVIGATLDNCLKVKGSSSKATYAAKNAPPFCEIWFVCKGKHVWTREASGSTDSFLSDLYPHETVLRERIMSDSVQSQISEPILISEYMGYGAFTGDELRGGNVGGVASRANSGTTSTNDTNQNSSEISPLTSPTSSFSSSVEINPKEYLELGMSYDRLKEATVEVERSKAEALTPRARLKRLETEIAETSTKEIMHDPQVAADGFTYEGNALRGWLQSGRDTSPMTNLKLEHRNLTPNHALRFAIHGWLCEYSTSWS